MGSAVCVRAEQMSVARAPITLCLPFAHSVGDAWCTLNPFQWAWKVQNFSVGLTGTLWPQGRRVTSPAKLGTDSPSGQAFCLTLKLL